MLYYRVTIILKHRQPSIGIRYYDNSFIEAVTNIVRSQAIKHFGENVEDVEAAMLSNHRTAGINYLESGRKRKESALSFIKGKKE